MDAAAESEGEQQARESDAQSQSSDASQAEDGPGSVVATPGSDAGSPTGASEAEEDAGSDGDSEVRLPLFLCGAAVSICLLQQLGAVNVRQAGYGDVP